MKLFKLKDQNNEWSEIIILIIIIIIIIIIILLDTPPQVNFKRNYL